MGVKKVVSIETCARTGERVNSPRSLEACRRTGIEPDELLPKAAGEFLGRSGKFSLVEKEAAVLRQQRYEQSRQLRLESVRKERELLLKHADADPILTARSLKRNKSTSPPRRAQSAGVTSSTWRAQQQPQDESWAVLAITDASTMVLLEEKRLAKLKLRQKREIQGVIEMETKMAKIQLENACRAAEEAKRKEEFQKELKAKRAALVATKHEREMEKKKHEDREAAQRKFRAKADAEKDKLTQDEELRKQQLRHHEAIQRELERAQKAEEFQRQTEALLRHQEELVTVNRQRMLEKERQVLTKVDFANRKRHQEALERRERANARIQQANMANQLSLQRKKSEIEEKQLSACERAKEIQKKTVAELKERSLQQRKDDDVRQKRLEMAMQQREKEKSRLLTKRQELEEKLERVNEERERVRLLNTVERTLSVEEKQHNVERIKRKEEYARLQLLQRISHEDERSRAIKMQKHALMQARKHVALDAMVRKHRIAQAVEQLHTSNKWDKIEETLYELGALLAGLWLVGHEAHSIFVNISLCALLYTEAPTTTQTMGERHGQLLGIMRASWGARALNSSPRVNRK